MIANESDRIDIEKQARGAALAGRLGIEHVRLAVGELEALAAFGMFAEAVLPSRAEGFMSKLALVVLLAMPSHVAFADGEHKEEIAAFVETAGVARSEAARKGGGRAVPLFKLCVKAYDRAIAAGVPPSQPIKQDGFDDTMEHIKTTVCDAAAEKLQDNIDAREAPYKKVLKNDKFDTWKSYAASIVLPGSADASVPANLAKADHWYVDTSPPESCPGGAQKHRLHRYQFNGEQKLVKTTDADFCGSPPASAYK